MLSARTALLTSLFVAACGSESTPAPDLGVVVPDDLSVPAVDGSIQTTFTDFPIDPIVDTSTPANAPTLFGAPTSGMAAGGPCLVDPQIGALFPGNWLRLRVHFIPVADQSLFEIRVHADHEQNDLVVYTASTTWTMPAAMWSALSTHIVGDPITVTVRGAGYASGALTSPPALGSSGAISIAPATAPGAIVYWTSSNGTALKGFTIGDETVHDVLRPTQISTGCVGCHASTPDGKFVGFSSASTTTGGNPASLALRSVDGALTTPAFITVSAQTLLDRQTQQQPVFSKAHWQAGDYTAVSAYQVGANWELIWTDLEASATTEGTGYGVFARTGDTQMAIAPTFSHDGKTVVYTSAAVVDGENAYMGGGDLRSIPYAARVGGASTAIAGASDPMYSENYAAFSPDDQFIAFSRVPNTETSVDNANAEVYVVPAAGGTATRIAANDSPACSGKVSPGITNSWAKWAPAVTPVGTKTYYWLTFSSRRNETGNPQLYVGAVVVDSAGATPTITTYPALYLWNQPVDENNHTPSWDVFQLPIL